jgi:predicted DNA-binding transcriptional regulator YafY
VVRIRYFATSRDEETERDVEPYALLSYSGAWYLIAWCRMRKGMRDFRVDRIAALHVDSEYFARDPDFDLDAYLGPAFSVFHGEKEHTVRVRFSPHQARWIREGVWHATQVLRDLPDGSVELTMTIRGMTDVAQWVLSFGGECEVLEPAELRERVQGGGGKDGEGVSGMIEDGGWIIEDRGR